MDDQQAAIRDVNEPPAGLTEEMMVPLPSLHTLAVLPSAEGVRLQVRGPNGLEQAEFELKIGPEGVVVRARTAALEIQSSGPLIASCEEFRLQARKTIDLVAGESIQQQAAGTVAIDAGRVQMDARIGGVRVSANDNVQLLGEQVLLNCDHHAAVPAWVPLAPASERTIAREQISGNPALAALPVSVSNEE
jgi:hypothetical protein